MITVYYREIKPGDIHNYATQPRLVLSISDIHTGFLRITSLLADNSIISYMVGACQQTQIFCKEYYV